MSTLIPTSLYSLLLLTIILPLSYLLTVNFVCLIYFVSTDRTLPRLASSFLSSSSRRLFFVVFYRTLSSLTQLLPFFLTSIICITFA